MPLGLRGARDLLPPDLDSCLRDTNRAVEILDPQGDCLPWTGSSFRQHQDEGTVAGRHLIGQPLHLIIGQHPHLPLHLGRGISIPSAGFLTIHSDRTATASILWTTCCTLRRVSSEVRASMSA
jgi:hypothetical protein